MDGSNFDKGLDAASYDRHALAYDRHIRRLAGPVADRTCELARLKPGDRVLDIGTGTGIAARRAARLVGPEGHVMGIDLSRGMISAARRCGGPEGGPSPDYRVMDAEALDLPDRSFDAALSMCAVCHFPNVARALAEMRRVLRPGGRLVVSYGSTRPVALLPLGGHLAGRALDRALQLAGLRLTGPQYLIRLSRRMLPQARGALHTEWGGRLRMASLARIVAEAGFEDVKAEWAGHDVLFDSGEEFWEAQSAVVTEVRKRLVEAPAEATERFRQAFVQRAEGVLSRGGKLIYPYGARLVAARVPH